VKPDLDDKRRSKSHRVVTTTREERLLLRRAARLLGELAGALKDKMVEPYSLSQPRQMVWPERTHQDLTAKRDFDEAIDAAETLMRIVRRRAT
jgi:hypothetical protein